MVLELLEGQTLAAVLQTQVVLSAEKAADLLVPIIAGVSAAHACGIVHRDLKPQNLFISQEHSNLVPRVLDFGISKLVDQAVPIHTRSDVILGTAHYLSPEQARGDKRIDARSDQYSLGAVLYECVTGRKPFDDDNLFLLINRISAGEFKPPSEVYSGVTPALEAVILKAMNLLPEDRYESAALLGQALLPFASYKTRLNYAQEFARCSDVAATAPFDANDYALLPIDAADARNAIPALSSALTPPYALRKQRFTSPRQLAAAIALVCAGVGVGYSLRFSVGVGNAAAPAQEVGSENAPPTKPEPASAAAAFNAALLPAPTLPIDTVTMAHSASAASVISAKPRPSEVAPLPSFGQKVRATPAASRTVGASSPPVQNRAEQHGLVQENPF